MMIEVMTSSSRSRSLAALTNKRQTLGGVEVVTIPLCDYEDLLSAKRLLAETCIDVTQFVEPKRSLISRHPEVASFLTQKFGKLPMAEILRQCRRRFGKHATPSKSAAYSYWQSLRRKARINS